MFCPQQLVTQAGRFVFSGEVRAVAHPCLHKEIIGEFWHNFSARSATLCLTPCDAFVFTVGNVKPLPLGECAYSIYIGEDGICVCAEGEQALLHGFMALLDRIKVIDTDDGIACALDGAQIRERALIQNRMVHFCVFPETELWELQHFLRFCGALRYTHVVLEFWGMLRYDCLAELSWQHAFEKEQIAPILREARDLGLEIIPMFNHWGHASAARVGYGKHVVLDQNPALQTYFSEDGWCWDIRKPKARQLLRCIREELIALCGEGSYFHIGCDEAFNFELNRENMDLLCDFINEIAQDLAAQGRRAIAWGDMLLYPHAHYNPQNKYTCNAPSPEAEQYMLQRLDRRIVIADWQYDAPKAPVETAAVFTQAGFDCLLCPWDRGPQEMQAVISTVKSQALFGVLHTTWHTLSKGTPYAAAAAKGAFEDIGGYDSPAMRTASAALWRRVMPCEGVYERAGWSRIQIWPRC